MGSFNNKKLIFAGLGVIIILGGLVALLYLVQSRQVIKSKAATSIVNVDVISPREDSKVLGLTQFRATAEVSRNPAILSSVLQTDGKDAQVLEVSILEGGKIAISGKWDSSKYQTGTHYLEVFLYDKSINPPSLLGSSRISVTVVPP